MFKKLIAKEYLVFISLLIIITVVNFSFYGVKTKVEDRLEECKIKLVQLSPEDSLKNVLRNYVEKANSSKYDNWEDLNSSFPELKKYDKQILMDYVATANSEKYDLNWSIINSKFPEFGFNKDGKINNNDQLKYLELKSEITKINSSFFVKTNTTTFLIYSTIILFFILFVLRYLYYGIVWSIKEITNRES